MEQGSSDLQKNLNLLKRTRQQLVGKEKLAAIGELSAGMAHEINNPTAVILGNMDLLMDALGGAGKPVRQEANLIIEQVYRIHAMNKQETAPGKLTIRSRNWRDEGVLITVRDNGSGIDPHVLPRIFDPFFSRSQTGTGLGLSVSFGILERFGAEIQVRSKLGMGSCFYLWFRTEPEANQAADSLTRNII